ncbi:copper transporter [Corynebacterium caspium]|uniref:copper transporter n=1 Tax=Corynebacterium caspium TaxID=234828 RepID=UPI000365F4AE|nr:copper transporter [Corynebacterium caspium]WKD59349.1 Copper transporter MctB precursor [Corynebacterium caspium DSM 44850]
MSKTTQGRSGVVIAGLGFGVAAGVALGVFAIAPNIPGGNGAEAEKAKRDFAAVSQDVEIYKAQAASADSVLSELAFSSVTGVLQDRSILVFKTADANNEDVNAVERLLKAAGATNSGEILLKEKFLDQAGADALKTIIVNTLPAGAQLSVDNLAPGNHSGEALGSALFLNPENGEPQAGEEERGLLLRALRDSGYINYEDGTILPAQGIVIITGSSDGAGEKDFSAAQLANFANALKTRGQGVVLSGRVHSAADTGTIGLIRSAKQERKPSTVDSVDRQWAQIATVIAMREQLDGGSGAYGAAASAEAAVPALPQPKEDKPEVENPAEIPAPPVSEEINGA